MNESRQAIDTHDSRKYSWSRTGNSELYNLWKDSGERNNIVAVPECGMLINELQEKIMKWQKKTGDKEMLIV